MKTITLTRRSKIGYGYTSAVETAPDGSLQVCDTTKPEHVGTIRQVLNVCDHDRELKLYRSGGTYYSEAWFTKIGGKWHKLTITDRHPAELMHTFLEQDWRGHWVRVYVTDSVEVEVI